jgi:hypothetical protein
LFVHMNWIITNASYKSKYVVFWHGGLCLQEKHVVDVINMLNVAHLLLEQNNHW